MYCQVQYNDYMLPTPEILAKLAPNNYTVKAYYMPMNAKGEEKIENVYLYQNDDYICEAKQIVKFNTSLAERTDIDTDAFTEQAKYIAKFDKMAKDGKNGLAKILMIENTSQYDSVEVETVPITTETVQDEVSTNYEDDDYLKTWALNSL